MHKQVGFNSQFVVNFKREGKNVSFQSYLRNFSIGIKIIPLKILNFTTILNIKINFIIKLTCNPAIQRVGHLLPN